MSKIEDSSFINLRREEANSIFVASTVINALADVYIMLYPDKEFEGFLSSTFSPLWEEDTNGDAQFEEIKEMERTGELNGKKLSPIEMTTARIGGLLLTSCSFAIQALKTPKNSSLSWAYVTDAMHWLGVLQGYMSGCSNYPLASSHLGRMGAKHRHAENRAIKEYVFKWLDQNMQNYKSMDAAAEVIARGIVPMTFRTVRAWITEWKKLRSTSKL